jgi:uncharacterized protein YbjT (DUF2867 family)
MKIIVTGSLGHISKPLTQELLQKGHSVTVISSKAERQKEIEALGAKAAIGSMQDADFLSVAFTGADAVYVMETMGSGGFSDQNLDINAAISKVCNNYKQAIQQAGVKRVVHLSSIGADTDHGNGLLAFHYYAEKIIDQLPSDVGITFMRPVGFYSNLLAFIPVIKTQGMIVSNYGGDVIKPWVSPLDIAAAVAEEITTPFVGRKVRYVASEEISCNDIAGILGAAIGKPDLKWVVISDEQMLNGMLAAGMNPRIAAGMVEMNASAGRHGSKFYEDYYNNHPVLGKIKIKDFAGVFAMIYDQK